MTNHLAQTPPTLDPWEPLQAGDIDPWYFTDVSCNPAHDCCNRDSPDGDFVCTRTAAHDGLHVAAYSNRRVCCDAWLPDAVSADPNERLPRGF